MEPGEKLAMNTRGQDILWTSVAVLCAGIAAGALVYLVRDFTFIGILAPLFPAFIAAGAWRRTKWGAPAGGLREHQERRALQRGE